VPQHGNPLLASVTPPQTYLHVGSEYLDFERDINSEAAVILVESDREYMRIDGFNSVQEVTDALAKGDGNPFLYNYQLAETFMR
jgi:hypothetical protein